MASPMIIPSTAAAPTAIPAITPPDKARLFELGCGTSDVSVALAITALVVLVVLILVVLGAGVIVALLVEAEVDEENPKRAKSFDWNSTVIGCPHIVIGPATSVVNVVVPSSTPRDPSSLGTAAATVVGSWFAP